MSRIISVGGERPYDVTVGAGIAGKRRRGPARGR